jgi:hypothetical protein
MKTKRARLSVFGCELILVFLLAGGLPAQQAPTAGSPQGQAVPHLVKFSGTVKDAAGTPRTGVTGIAFALYKDQAGGAALWLETQNVTLDAQGRYTVLLGSNSAEGLPVDVFSANQAQWLGIQPEGQAEQRVLLVSVPYALKAADAETLGGMPASSFVLAAPVANSGSGGSGSQTAGTTGTSSAGSSTNGISPATTCTSGSCAVSTSAPGGTVNFLPLFMDATTVQNSVMSQGPCPFDANQTCVGITNTNPPLTLFTPTASPTRVLDVNGEIRVGGGNIFMQRDLSDLPGRRNWAWGTETFNVGDVSLFVSASNTALPSLPVFTALSNGFMGVGVATPAANLEVAGTGGGLLVDSPGVITGSGAGLKNLPAASLTGTLPVAALNGVSGAGLTNVNAATLAGNLPNVFATTLSNTFTGNQSVAGSLSLTGSLAGTAASLNSLALPNTTSASVGVITLGATPFLHNFGTNNTFVGASAGNMTTTGTSNTAVGASALTANTTGQFNAAFGYNALNANTTGGGNAAFGYQALQANTTGGGSSGPNSAFGYQALQANTTGNLNSAFGALTLNANTTGSTNSAFGNNALSANTTGTGNAGFGNGALKANTTGPGNAAFGSGGVLMANTTGESNSAFGLGALNANTTASYNSAFGAGALHLNTTGGGNAAFGISALFNLNGGTNNTAIGQFAGSNLTAGESNNIYIGNAGVAGESNTIRIGDGTTQTATFLAGNVTAAGMVQSAAGGFKFPDNTIQTTAATGGGGGGTVTSVGSGLGLKGGPITTTGTLAIDPTVIPQLGAANTFSANQTITGNNSTQIVSITQNGAGNGLVASTASTTASTGAVVGTATGSGEVAGVAGFATGSGGAGVFGQASGSNGAAGVFNFVGTGTILVGWASGVDVFRVDSTGRGFFDGGTQTGGADFAESLAVAGDRASYESGDLLVIDPAGERRLALARRPYSTLVAGIYSTKPGVLATPYQIDDVRVSQEVPLAVVGVVPCKVSAENGPIAVGDMLVTSRTPGHAMKGSNRSRMLGAVVGKALEPLTSGKGVIQVLVTLQ